MTIGYQVFIDGIGLRLILGRQAEAGHLPRQVAASRSGVSSLIPDIFLPNSVGHLADIIDPSLF